MPPNGWCASLPSARSDCGRPRRPSVLWRLAHRNTCVWAHRHRCSQHCRLGSTRPVLCGHNGHEHVRIAGRICGYLRTRFPSYKRHMATTLGEEDSRTTIAYLRTLYGRYTGRLELPYALFSSSRLPVRHPPQPPNAWSSSRNLLIRDRLVLYIRATSVKACSSGCAFAATSGD